MSRCKKESNQDAPLDTYALKEFCEKRSQWPEDRSAPFVSKHTIERNGLIPTVGFCMTTRNLLRAALQRGDLLHADATYKVMWHEWPVCIPSITNHDGPIHPLGIAVLSGEDTSGFNQIYEKSIY